MSQFSKERLNSLLHGVIFTVQDQLQKNDKFNSIVLNDDKSLELNLLFTKFSLSLIGVIKKESIDIFEKILDLLNEFNIDNHEIKDLFFSYFEYFYSWLCNCCDCDIDRLESTIKDFETMVKNNTGIDLDLTNDKGILVFKSDLEDDKNIDRDHFVNAKKISAKEFMDDSFVDDDLKADIYEAIQQFENVDNFTVAVSKEYIESTTSVLKDFIMIFDYGNEFKSLKESLEVFSDKIGNYDIDSLSDKQKILLKEFISNVMEDLINWNKKVIFEQTAVDIHYLDASINANISQFDMILGSI